MRYVNENPFINHECARLEIDKAPINTGVYETYSQCNEDLIVDAVLRAHFLRSGRSLDTMRYVEIGANHPIQTSSTYLFYRLYGASGVLVEPNPALADILERTRPRDTVVRALVTTSLAETLDLHLHEKNELSSVSIEHIDIFQGFGGRAGITRTIACRNLHVDDFLKTYANGPIDYLSIDVEGLDLELIRAMNPEFWPTIVQCEHEQKFDDFVRLFEAKGYGLLAVTDVNVLFLRRGAM